ncbi:MAG: hypothetical protein JKY42_09920 [Flavobacteriales bacterium]|nr:hypothetical protein [Flavobacteriales bacterium]
MKEAISKFTFPVVLLALGLGLLILGGTNDQNSWFMMASGAVLLAGVVTLLNALDMISKMLRLVILGVLVVCSVGLAWLDYKSIADPVAFMKEKERRYEYVIQRLKDLREAEFAYKTKYRKYCNNMDTLINFLKNDSLLQIKADGLIPDGYTEQMAIDSGYYEKDTTLVAAAKTVFDPDYLFDHKGEFSLDSLPYVPFTDNVKFRVEAGLVEKNGLDVHVFQVTDAQPFDVNEQLQVGSMSSPSTSGNWE